jgi:hypothetical protein
MLVIVVVNQSIMGRPPLQLKLSARRSQFQPNLRQSPWNTTKAVHKTCLLNTL